MSPSLIEQERKDRALLEGMDSRYFGSSTCLTIYAAGVSFAPERDLNPVMKMAVPTPEKARVNGARGGAVRKKQAAIKRSRLPNGERRSKESRFTRLGDPTCAHEGEFIGAGTRDGRPRERCGFCRFARFKNEADRVAANKYLQKHGLLKKAK